MPVPAIQTKFSACAFTNGCEVFMRFPAVFRCCTIPALIALVSSAALITTGAADDTRQSHTRVDVAQSDGPQLYQQPLQSVHPSPTLFWMVNSHYAAQHRKEQCRGPLLFQQRTNDGQWRSGTEAGFQAQFVPGVPVAIFVHGSFVEPETQLAYAKATYEWIHRAAPGRPLHVVFYNWPSGSPYTHLFGVDVSVRGARAEFNAFHLSRVMTLIPAESPVTLIGHSHGARTALATLHLAHGGSIQDHVLPGNTRCPRRLRAVLAAAAVDHHWANPGERYGCALFGSDVVNFKNRKDFALNFYPLARPCLRPSLATAGFTDGDREDMGPLGWRAIDVDVSHVVREAHTWPNYVQSNAIAIAMSRYLHFDDEHAVATQPAPFTVIVPTPDFDD